MSPGDFVITANWAPHDHGNTSDKPMLWLDVLDFPQVNFFEASFAEEFEFGDAAYQSRRRRFARAVRVGCAARRGAGADEPQPRDQLHLRAHPPDHRAHAQIGRHRQSAMAHACATPIRSMAGRFCPP